MIPQNNFSEIIKFCKNILQNKINSYICIKIIFMSKVKEVDLRDVFMQHMKKPEVDRDLAWLEKNTGLSYSHLYYIFVKKERPLTDENRAKFNQLLGTNF